VGVPCILTSSVNVFLVMGRQYTCMHSAGNEKSIITTRAEGVPAIRTRGPRHRTPEQTRERALYFLPGFCCDLITFLTIFASSTRNARRMRCLTQSPHLEPPYALRTVFFVFDTVAYWRGRRAMIPGSAMPQSPHLGAVASFLIWW